MAERTISSLVETLQPANFDVVPVVNASITKKVTIDNLVRASTFSNTNIRNLSAQDISTNPSIQFIAVQNIGGGVGKVSIQDLYPIVIPSSTINLTWSNNNRNLQAFIISNSVNNTHLGTGVVQTTAIADGAITEQKIDPNAKIRGATGGGTDRVFYENDQNVFTSYTITSGKNAMSAGTITIQGSATVTVPNGSIWTVV